jgi:Chromo (CHRromatin Organisation MOdifier) domain
VESGDVEFEIERILDSRVVRGSKQYLVKWKGYVHHHHHQKYPSLLKTESEWKTHPEHIQGAQKK